VIPHVAVRSRIQLVKVYLTLGDISTARHLMHEIDEILVRRPDLGALVGEVASVREVVTTSEQSPSSHSTPLTPAELRLLPYLQTHLTFREIGERLFVTRNTVATQVGSIYRKLGVSSRRGAVEAATTVGLLGG
jgi:LuxR family maltose regulon positive regulatory protein